MLLGSHLFKEYLDLSCALLHFKLLFFSRVVSPSSEINGAQGRREVAIVGLFPSSNSCERMDGGLGALLMLND
jgi:hypothetical protein